MIVGAYSLDLYCDNGNAKIVFEEKKDLKQHYWDEFPHQYVSETREGCFKLARLDGWLLNLRANKALCPSCSGKRYKKNV